MNFDPLQPLDAPEEAKKRPVFPEHRFFLVLFALQYLSLFFGTINGLFFSIVLAGILHIFIGILQLSTAVISDKERRNERLRRLYFKLVGFNFILILIFTLIPEIFSAVPAGMGLAFSIFVLPHALAWFYWYISYHETK